MFAAFCCAFFFEVPIPTIFLELGICTSVSTPSTFKNLSPNLPKGNATLPLEEYSITVGFLRLPATWPKSLNWLVIFKNEVLPCIGFGSGGNNILSVLNGCLLSNTLNGKID